MYRTGFCTLLLYFFNFAARLEKLLKVPYPLQLIHNIFNLVEARRYTPVSLKNNKSISIQNFECTINKALENAF